MATRTFELAVDGSPVPVLCKIYRPEPSDDGETYFCWLEVGWPDGAEMKWSAGVDGMQALTQGFVALGISINKSEAAKQNGLTWLGASGGFGLPLPLHLWDQYREYDRQDFVGEYRVPRPPRYHRLNLRSAAPKHVRMQHRLLNRCWCGGIVGNSRKPKSRISRPD
jgi:hypothetical protein